MSIAREITVRALSRIIAPLFLLAGWSTPSLADHGLKFGVFPNLSARVMVETYQPLANYLADALKRPVTLESAPDFHTFNQRTMDGEYDVLLTAPHLAWIAWKDAKYQPVLTYEEPAKGFLIVRADSSYQKIADLKDKTIAMPDPLAVVNIRMEKILEKEGLKLGQDLKNVDTGSHTNAATHVYQGHADAAVVGVLAFQRLAKEVRDSMRIIAETPAMTSHVFLVHRRTSGKDERATQRAIEAFTQSEAGLAFLKKGGFGGVRPLKKGELQVMEADAQELKHRLETTAGM